VTEVPFPSLKLPYIHHPIFNPLTPNDPYSGRTAPLTSKRCILYIYSTNIGTEYFKHGVYCPFFPLQNAVCFIILTYLIPVLFMFYIQNVLKLKKIIPVPKGYFKSTVWRKLKQHNDQFKMSSVRIHISMLWNRYKTYLNLAHLPINPSWTQVLPHVLYIRINGMQ